MAELNLPIDRFKNIASWMDDIQLRLSHLESELKRTDYLLIQQGVRIHALEVYTNGLQVVMQPPEPE